MVGLLIVRLCMGGDGIGGHILVEVWLDLLIYVESQDCLSKRAFVETGDTPTYIVIYETYLH